MSQSLKFGHKKLYIDGQLCESSHQGVFEVVCPGTEESIASLAWASREDTERALTSAQKGFEYWSKLPLSERLEWIDKLRHKLVEKQDLLREAIMHEMGKTWEGTEEDVTSIVKSLAFYSDEIQKRDIIPIADQEGTHTHHMLQQPLGVVVAFLAYNFPLLNLGFKLGPALAAGCSIVLKPSEFSPLSAYLIGEICEEIDFPKGVITILSGELMDVGIPLCESTIPKLITMIGSTETAQKLIGQSSKTSIKRYSMECGGNAPFIVLEDADLELAVNIGSALKLGNSGQICVAPNRFFVHESVMDAFVHGMKDKLSKAKVGFGRENQPDMGPLANRRAVFKVDELVKEAQAQGGKVVTGGQPLYDVGYYYAPTVIVLDNPTAPVLQKEVFGPVVLVVPFSRDEDALKYANDTDAGLASYVFTRDLKKQEYFEENLAFGEVQINGVKYDIYLPHGGVKNSGIGVDCSTYALDDYLIRKRVTKALNV
ncbi:MULTISPECIES: aldehyde dehydrogenase family protein [Reichenbachiella]|uniref:aldehyde dehydrogenase family protein n=1 Tax=Reichenbachiella TaxID=156993 RepID=UPI000E6B7FC1|nr:MULTISPECIES: aldehyde dehydrogenase family protein [Reichenbachiella]MBU2912754.1 aldehyde dehydrogenase family protein [Reichenbachiella agariperforans]RJE72430.1 NAD-dependent succinate-semialdehyde dehydrogenase [Reichenbachiella sp. MSK19-1]